MRAYIDRALFQELAGPFKKWPDVLCTECGKATLEPTIDFFETRSSIYAREDEDDWDGWTYGYFHGRMTCPRVSCGNKHAVIGEWADHDRDIASVPGDVPRLAGYMVRQILPPFPLIDLPSGTPIDVQILLMSVSSVLLSDPNAAANRMRSTIESLLNSLGVRKFPPGRRALSSRLSTHARIMEFRQRNPGAGDCLMAIKWIGNAGSHDAEPLPLDATLDGIELFAYAIHSIYDDKERELKKKAARIIKLKGPMRPV